MTDEHLSSTPLSPANVSPAHLSPGQLSPEQLSPENERSLKTLLRAITLTRGDQFTMKLARCNYATLRSQVMQRLKQECPVEIQELWLEPFTPSLTEAIATAPQNTTPAAASPILSIQGIEQVADVDALLALANQSRDSLSQHLSLPIILWVTDEVVERMIRIAPDWWNFISHPVAFRPSPSELVDVLQVHTQQLWDVLLQPTGPLFSQDEHEGDPASILSCAEVKAAQKDLADYEYELSPILNASLQLQLGREQFQKRSQESGLNTVIQHYRESLDSLQTQEASAKIGILQMHLGLCCWQQAEGDRAHQSEHWQEAEHYFREALTAFEQGDFPHLNARFIGYLGETLKRLADWDALESVVEEAIALHQTGDRPTELAQDYGFKAELCLKHTKEPEAAERYAQQALDLLDESSTESNDRGLFLLLLAQAKHQLGQGQEAIAHLREAKEIGKPNDNPYIYIKILDKLSKLYFDQKDYRTAFDIKRDRIAYETQYGFRAFIGAGRLRPKQSTTPNQPSEDTIATEISVSERQQDVEKLWGRITDAQCRLTILHGPLGVGKSSVLRAGLIPALPKRFQTYKIISILTDIYTDCRWAERLGENLSSELQENFDKTIPLLKSPDDILTQFQKNYQDNIIIVLIFDQFEEFFFNCREISERQKFFSFLGQCLNLPFVNIILSLREDYLHYLLEWERYSSAHEDDIKPIYDNILSEQHRHSISNFKPDEARNILKELTDRAQSYLESELLDRLVQDLTINNEVKPIELQVVGIQLQIDNITTLGTYRAIGENQKEILVQKYLESIIKDCGTENKKAAELILYVLTDENNTRPPRTRHEIESEIQILEEDLLREVSQIELILYIFQKSGLIFLIPEIPSDRYQLVHDYLVKFIRQKQPKIEQLIIDLKNERRVLKKTQDNMQLVSLVMLLDQKVAEEKENAARSEMKIFSLEKEIAEERAKKIHEKMEREKQLNRYKFFSLIVFSLVTSFIAMLTILGYKTYESIFDQQISNTLMAQIKHAKDLAKYKDASTALPEILKVAHNLKEQRRIFEFNDGRIAMDTIGVLQEVISSISDENGLPEKEIYHFNKSIYSLSDDEKYELLVNLIKNGCNYLYLDNNDLNNKLKKNICPHLYF